MGGGAGGIAALVGVLFLMPGLPAAGLASLETPAALAPITDRNSIGGDAADRVGFVEAAGRVLDPAIRFYATSGAMAIGFADDAVLLVLSGGTAADRPDPTSGPLNWGASGPTWLIRIAFPGGSPVTPQGRGPLPHRIVHAMSPEPADWRSVRAYQEIAYENLFEGIDLVFRMSQGLAKYEYRVRPGASPEAIAVSFEGATHMSLNETVLTLHTPAGDVRDGPVVAFQAGSPVVCTYDSRGAFTVGFACEEWDPAAPLVIDPFLEYSTFLGGDGEDVPWAIAADGAGYAYVTGQTQAPNFPITPGAFDASLNGSWDVFVAKLDPSGGALVYATYLGGSSGEERGMGIAVDPAGNAFVTGFTDDADFPTTTGAFDRMAVWAEAFLVKLDPTGGVLFSTFVGGNGFDGAWGVGLDPAGNVYLGGLTFSSDFPVTAGAFDVTYGDGDAFVAKLDPTGSMLLAATFVGGSRTEYTRGAAVDSEGNVYVTGMSVSSDFPVTPWALDPWNPDWGWDAFVAKVDPTGTALVYGSYLGGDGTEFGYGIAADGMGNAYVTGETNSMNFPTTLNALQGSTGGSTDSFLVKFDPSGQALYSTYLGGVSYDSGWGIVADASGSAYGTGTTASADFPLTPGAFDMTLEGVQEAYVVKVDASGTRIYASLLGAGGEVGRALAVDGNGSAYLAGQTASAGFPTTVGSFDGTFAPPWDGFVAKLNLSAYSVTVDTSPPGLLVNVGGLVRPAPYSFWCVPGTSFVVGAATPQILVRERHEFSTWSDGGNQSHTLACDRDQTVTASFSLTGYHIFVNASPGGQQVSANGSTSRDRVDYWCTLGDRFNIDAPSPQLEGAIRYTFSRWLDGGAQSHEVACTQAWDLWAIFATEFEVEVATDPPGLNVSVDGAIYREPHRFWCPWNTTHELSAPSPQGGPSVRHEFTGWRDEPQRTRTILCTWIAGFTATFHRTFRVTVRTDAPGIPISIDGTDRQAPHTFYCREGEFYALEVPRLHAEQTVLEFTGWEDGRTEPQFVERCDRPSDHAASYRDVAPWSSSAVVAALATSVALPLAVALLLRPRKRKPALPVS